MNKGIVPKALLLPLCLFLAGCGNKAGQDTTARQETGTPAADTVQAVVEDTVPQYIAKLMKAYPEAGLGYEDNNLLFPDGTRIVCDDGRAKTFVQALDDCDIEDMFSLAYDKDADKPSYLHDCGRGRNEALFKKMYGSSEAEVRRNLVKVDWFGRKVPFTKVNGAAAQLEKVRAELEALPQYRKYLVNASSFYWRKVRGANRQSAHSYGIAIDINTEYSNYWLWANPKSLETDSIEYVNRIPQGIVRVFEKHGFIWGGRWYHYDTMHFEYRPELLAG